MSRTIRANPHESQSRYQKRLRRNAEAAEQKARRLERLAKAFDELYTEVS